MLHTTRVTLFDKREFYPLAYTRTLHPDFLTRAYEDMCYLVDKYAPWDENGAVEEMASKVED
jgi:hypothetical protein